MVVFVAGVQSSQGWKLASALAKSSSSRIFKKVESAEEFNKAWWLLYMLGNRWSTTSEVTLLYSAPYGSALLFTLKACDESCPGGRRAFSLYLGVAVADS